MKTFDLDGKTYRTEGLDAFSQIHIGLKIAPLFERAMEGVEGEVIPLGHILDVLSRISISDIDYVMETVLPTVKRQEGSTWADIYNRTAKRLSYNDISAANVLKIVSVALEDQIIPFFGDLVRMVSGSTNPTPGS